MRPSPLKVGSSCPNLQVRGFYIAGELGGIHELGGGHSLTQCRTKLDQFVVVVCEIYGKVNVKPAIGGHESGQSDGRKYALSTPGHGGRAREADDGETHP